MKTETTNKPTEINAEELAERLYAMCQDMDSEDYSEQKEEEIHQLAMELKMLIELGCNTLLKALEIITGMER